MFCDIDGTLAPIVDDPAAAAVPQATRELLSALAERYGLVGCLTGRRALDARRIVGVEEIAYAGNHGFEMLPPGAGTPAADPAVGGREEAARRFVATLGTERLLVAGIRVEDKGAIQALHWRGASREADAADEARALANLARAAGLVPRWGRKVLEIRPVAGIDKGSAATRMLRERGVAAALFGGDDVTDLDAFQALRWLSRSERLRAAVCVGVASSEQPEELAARTDVVVDGPEGFVLLLEELLP